MDTDMKPTQIPLCVPEIRGREWEFIKDCLDTNWVSSVGPYVDRFEIELARFVGSRWAVATCSGTAALHIALLAAGIQPEEEVLVPALSFVAPANAVRYVGAFPVFMDVDPEFWQLDPDKVAEFIEGSCRWVDGKLWDKHTRRVIGAILPVHILGHPVDMDPIIEVANKYELKVIEDATESLGARYRDRTVGTLGDIACFSFNGNKIITTGGGGMVVGNRERHRERAHYLSTQAKDDPIEFLHKEIGFNYRLPNILAAMGIAQLESINDYITAKRGIADRYNRGLGNVPGVKLPSEAKWARSVFWMYTILIDESRFGCSSRSLLERLAQKGIQTRPLWHPLNQMPPYEHCHSYRVEVTPEIYRKALSLPCSVGLTHENQDRVISEIRTLLS